MVYLDTSVLVALHTREATTEALVNWYDANVSTQFATATWTITEFASALGIKQRTRQITTREAKAAWKSFSDQCTSELRVFDILRVNFVEAAEMIRADTSGLRSGDALHLAAARQSGSASLASLDNVMRRTARQLGMATVEFEQVGTRSI